LFTNCQKLSTHIRKQQTQRVLIGANYFIMKTISTKYAAISKILSFLAFASFFDPCSIFFQTWIYVQKIANNKSSKDQSKILFLKKTELKRKINSKEQYLEKFNHAPILFFLNFSAFQTKFRSSWILILRLISCLPNIKIKDSQ
jgi:hypothetical protein